MYHLAPHRKEEMDLRNFIQGNAEQRDEYVGVILAHSIDYTTTLMQIIDRWIEELPQEMIDELASSIDNFMGKIGEFVDVELMYKEIDEESEKGDYDSAA